MPFAVRANSLAAGVVSYRLLSVASTWRSRFCASATAAHSGPVTSAARMARARAARVCLTLRRFRQPPGQREREVAAAFGKDEAREGQLVQELAHLVHAEVRCPGGSSGGVGLGGRRPVLAGQVKRGLTLAKDVVGPLGVRAAVLHYQEAGPATVAERPIAG